MSNNSNYQPQPEEISSKPKPGKGVRETDARIIIDRLLREAGWNIEDKNQVATEESANADRVDYLLKDRRGRGLAIIEAKRFSIDPVSAKSKSEQYAKTLKVDFIFLSNGEDIYFWDYNHRPEQKVNTFFSQRDLEKIKNLRTQKKPVSLIPIPENIWLFGEEKIIRPYQIEAMKVMDHAIESNKRKMLMVMATGTGKTLLIALQIKRMFEAGLIHNVLFLVDRVQLGIQAQDTFNEVLKDYTSQLLYGGKEKKEGQIIIATLPTIYSQLTDFTSGYFDLIISDEAHRSIYGIYNAVLSYFDAIKIGLTATPSLYIERNTYHLFDCWDEINKRGKPTFIYGIQRGIKENHLAGYEIVRIDTKVSLKGVIYEGEDYAPEDLERRINVPARNKQVVESYKAEEEKRIPKKHRKTIVYAITKKHAAQLAYYFNQAYPEYNGRFAEVITSDIPDADRAIDRFKKEELPFIAVSVGMMDTGFDAPKVENLIMVRPTKSPILYQQMRGRGSRLCPSIGKKSFRLYDFVGVTRFFNDESYNPYSEIEKARHNIVWGAEEVELTPDEKELAKRGFVQIPETAQENVDVIIKREFVEIGAQGERIDVDDYQSAWERKIQELAKTDPVIQKMKNRQELTIDDIKTLSTKLNSPQFYFNEANLREAYHYPYGTLPEFIKTALGISKLPTEEQIREDKVTNLFESWLIEKNVTSIQTKILRMVKTQYISNREKIDISIFNKALFSQFGGLTRIISIFGEKEIQNTLNELNTRIFAA